MTKKGEWITVSEAAKLTGYNEEYITTLCREGKIKAQKYSIVWQIDRDSLLGYVARIEQLGNKRGPKSKN